MGAAFDGVVDGAWVLRCHDKPCVSVVDFHHSSECLGCFPFHAVDIVHEYDVSFVLDVSLLDSLGEPLDESLLLVFGDVLKVDFDEIGAEHVGESFFFVGV